MATLVLNEDVLYCIFEQFIASKGAWYQFDITARIDDADKVVRRQTLASCARVCRAFVLPAMSVLWRDLDSLEPLKNLSKYRVLRGSKVVGSTPTPLHWPTYSQYLQWVRVISTPYPMLSTTLADVAQPASLHLARLRWVQEVPGTMDVLQILSPALHSLHIIFRSAPAWDHHRRNEYQKFVERLLLRAAETAPSLSYLRITRGNGIPEEWLRPVSQFSVVQVLDIYQPSSYDSVTTGELLPGLGSLENLRRLKLRLPNILRNPSVNETQSFKALRTLHLDGRFASLHDTIHLLLSVSSPYLESFHLNRCECDTGILSTELHKLCAILHAKFASTLHTIILSITPIGSAVVFEQPLVEYLAPLLRIRGLRDVRLQMPSPSKNVLVVVTESDLATIAESWPHVEHLDLNCTSTEAPSLGALVPFARHCAFLGIVHMPRIDARDVGTATGTPPHHFLRSFSICDEGWDSLIPDPQGLACYLKQVFPNASLCRKKLASGQWCKTVDAMSQTVYK